jgi:hypothetical protein
MAFLKFSSDLFLGSLEIEKFKRFLDDDGFRKIFLRDSVRFGLFNNSPANGEFDNFRISQGTNLGTIQHNEGLGIDNQGRFIFREALDNISLIDDNNWYWIKISHAPSSSEVGTVSISANGQLTGLSTRFTNSLRGLPNLPSKVRFEGSTLNTGEYTIAEVISDTSAVAQGIFQSESDVRLVVIGTFTPDSAPSASEKEIFQYDSSNFEMGLETLLETPPTIINGEEFLIARVRRNGSAVSINDIRSRFIYESKASFAFNFLDTEANPLIGVEFIKFDHPFTAKDRNITYIAWSFRSSNWTFDSSLNRVTLSSGEGGKFKTTADFSNGDFNGWRLYYEDGTYSIIRNSSLQATQINLDVDSVDFTKLENASQQLLVTPNVEDITIHFRGDATVGQEITELWATFPINLAYAKIPTVVYNTTGSSYVVRYQYKQGLQYSLERSIPSDPIGFWNEFSFNDNGSFNLPTSTRSPYVTSNTVGFINFNLKDNAFIRIIDSVISGDAGGINFTAFSNLNPTIFLTPGTSNRRQYFDHTNTPINFTVDHFIDLVREDGAGNTIIQDGSSFDIEIRGDIDLAGNSLQFTDGFVNPGNPGTILLNLSQNEISEADNFVLRYEFVYSLDADRWIVYRYKEIVGDELTPGQLAALSGTNGTPSDTNRYITDSDPRVPTLAENEALVGTDGVPSTSNRYITNSDDRVPTSSENAALAGTNSTPSDTNRYVTNSDSRNTNSRTPNGASGGDLSGPYPNPSVSTVGGETATNIAARSPSAGEKAALAATSGSPTNTNRYVTNSDSRNTNSRAPNGVAGGEVLDGSYPNPGIAPGTVIKYGGASSASFVNGRIKFISTGPWDMQTLNNISVNHGLDQSFIRSITVFIEGDTIRFVPLTLLNNTTGVNIGGGIVGLTSSTIDLMRITGGFFDDIEFNNASGNRGRICIIYEDVL